MKGISEKHPKKMKKRNDNQNIGGPVVNIPDELSEGDIVLEGKNRFVRTARGWFINK
jgi:hypothetical protein